MSRMGMQWWKYLWELFFPPLCEACGCRLVEGEQYLCVGCVQGLARTELHHEREGRFEKLFWGKFPVERATAYYFYDRSVGVRQLVHAIKYKGCWRAGDYVGGLVAEQVNRSSNFFDGIDFVVPVPLHPAKARKRGYNQSEMIARGVARATGIPLLVDCVVRVVNNPTQTRLNQSERSRNVANVFQVVRPEWLVGKHVLLIDDVVTTGSTLSELGAVIAKEVDDARISVFALAVAHV